MFTWAVGIFNKHVGRVLMYGVIILGTGFFLYSAFLKPSSTTNIASGGRVINVFDQPKQSLFNFGCSNLQIEAYWKKNLRHN